MKSKKILFILMPLIVILLVLGGGFAYLMLNSTPEKIYTSSINKVFDVLKSEKEQIKTLKGRMTLSGSIESEDEEIQSVNDILEKSSITIDMALDEQNIVLNESVDVTYDSERLLYATFLLQDEKGYVYLPDWLDKYLEISSEELEIPEIEDVVFNANTLNEKQLLNVVQNELLNLISKQELVQRKNGKIKESILDLSQEEFCSLFREMCINLKQNETFNSALGYYKDDVIDSINDIIAELSDYEADEESRVVIVIYTEGLLNKFAGISVELKDGADIEAGTKLIISDNIYEFSMYEQYDEEREEHLNVLIEDKKESKNKGTATITISADEEEFVIIYEYENKDNQNKFIATTEIEGMIFEVSNNSIENENNYKGNLMISIGQEEGTVNLNFDYDYTYNEEIPKTNIENAVLMDELNEEDQEEFLNNFKNSKLYEIIEQSGISDYINVAGLYFNIDEPVIKYHDKTVKYNVPTTFTAIDYNTQDYKTYTDETYNSIYIFVEEDDAETYLTGLENDYVITSDFYKNQELSEVSDYEINGKKYRYRTIKYSDEYSSYVKLYFAYELEDGYTYVVEVKSENGDISLDDINMFLDITVENIMPTDDLAPTDETVVDILQ